MSALLAIVLAASGPDPATLKAVRFAPAGDVARIRAGTWSIIDRRNDRTSIEFRDPGRLVLFNQEGDRDCTITSSKAGDAWEVMYRCTGLAPFTGEWTWLSADRVRVHLYDRTHEMARFDRGIAEVEKSFLAEYEKNVFVRFGGRWESDGAQIV